MTKGVREMKKRLLSGLLAVLMLVALFPAALAATPSEEEAAQALAALDIMVGGENGDLMLSRSVTRAEFTKMTIAASIYGDGVGGATTVSPYPDVPYTHWAASYIQTAVQAGYITGYLDGTFRPNNTITLAEGVTMVLRLLGYQNSDFSGAYPSGQMALYKSLKLDVGVTVTGNSSTLTRRDALYLFYNLLTARDKSGQVYLTTLGHTLTASGEIDLVALINSAMDGPVVASVNWQSQVPFDVNAATIYRSGQATALSSIQSGDVVYWSKSMRTLWAYTNRVSGTYESASPNASNPSSVTVAGKTYSIETASAAYALSDLGSFRTGDQITLLLGRTGGVAAVQKPGQSASVVYGIITAISSSSYTDQNGNTYSTRTATIKATDGGTYSYPCDNKGFKEGNLVQVTTSSGQANLRSLSSNSLSGKVNASATQVGTRKLAANVEILDTWSTGGMRIYPQRLAGVGLENTDVRFYALNAQGEITHLILDDLTGDRYEFGVLTRVQESTAGMSAMGSYQFDIGGVSSTYSSLNSAFNVTTGPCRILRSTGVVSSISNLTSVKLTGVSDNTALASSRSYPISDAVAVYELDSNNTCQFSSLARVSGGDYTLTGWYDSLPADGGMIRVIVARANG